MITPDIADLLENLKQLNMAMKSLEDSKKNKPLTPEEEETLHREEFRLSVEESSIRRKLDRQVKNLEQDPSKKFIVNRIKKTLEKV